MDFGRVRSWPASIAEAKRRPDLHQAASSLAPISPFGDVTSPGSLCIAIRQFPKKRRDDSPSRGFCKSPHENAKPRHEGSAGVRIASCVWLVWAVFFTRPKQV